MTKPNITQRLTDLERDIAALREQIAALQRENADLKSAQRMMAAAIRELNAPTPAIIANINRSRQ